jgi:hypothetical protein
MFVDKIYKKNLETFTRVHGFEKFLAVKYFNYDCLKTREGYKNILYSNG